MIFRGRAVERPRWYAFFKSKKSFSLLKIAQKWTKFLLKALKNYQKMIFSRSNGARPRWYAFFNRKTAIFFAKMLKMAEKVQKLQKMGIFRGRAKRGRDGMRFLRGENRIYLLKNDNFEAERSEAEMVCIF